MVATVHPGVSAFGIQSKASRGVFEEGCALPPSLGKVQETLMRFARRQGIGLDGTSAEVAQRVRDVAATRRDPAQAPSVEASTPRLG